MNKIAAIVAAAAFAGAANATVITSYTLFQEPGNQVSTPATTSAANVAGLDMTRSANLNPTAAGNSISANGWTPDSNSYFSFGFSVDAGFVVNLNELIIATRASNTGPGELGLFYSGDNFSTNLHTFTQSGTSFLNSTIDLSALTNLDGSVEFRISPISDLRADGNMGIASGGTLRISEFFDGSDFFPVQFTGEVVPAPASAALLGLAGLVAGRRRRA
ncbi:MAG: PEP-CTERM sorting domain-containing protein [Phycisphaerales bacterium]|nr:PEP-CTERM sorting domain-containing protein [Phycisphaerales bacterium]